MSQVNETGHTKNVSTFLALLNFVQGWGTSYQPTNPQIALANITAQHPICEAAEKEARDEEKKYNDLVDDRQVIFEPLQQYATRIYNSFSAIGLPKQTVDGALEINRKIQGRRATPKKDKPATEGTPTPANSKGGSISASQQSFDNNVKHLDDLRAWVELQPNYNPNEPDLKVAAIKAYHKQLDDVNKAVIAAEAPYNNKLDTRDEVLYASQTGMVDIALEIKKYARGAFGTQSPKYKQIAGLKFRKLPRVK